MEVNNDIFLAGDDALDSLGGQMHKKCFMKFIWSNSVSTAVSSDQFFYPSRSPLVRTCTHLDDSHILRM